MKRRPGKVNHKRRMTDAQKERQKQERWDAKKNLPRIEVDLGGGKTMRIIDEHAGEKPLGTIPPGEYGGAPIGPKLDLTKIRPQPTEDPYA